MPRTSLTLASVLFSPLTVGMLRPVPRWAETSTTRPARCRPQALVGPVAQRWFFEERLRDTTGSTVFRQSNLRRWMVHNCGHCSGLAVEPTASLFILAGP